MPIKIKLVMVTAVVAAMAGLADARPQIGVAAGVRGVGNQAGSIEVHGSAKTTGDRFRVSLETEGPSTMTTTLVDGVAGGHNGWPIHSGMVSVTLNKGLASMG